MTYQTLPQIIHRLSSEYNYPKHFHSRWQGSWRSWSTAEFVDDVQAATLGLAKLGVTAGDCVGLIGPPSTEWVVADYAINCNGATTVPMFDKIASETFEFQVLDADVTTMIVVGDAALNFVMANRAQIKQVIALNCDQALPEGAVDGAKLLELGRKEPRERFDELSQIAQPEDLATIVYTSGSTGRPKGVELSHRALCSQFSDLLKRFPSIDSQNERMLVALPLAHVFSRHISYSGIAGGSQVFWVDDVTELANAAREVRPTTTTAVPRLLEKIYLRMREGALKLRGPRRWLALWAMKLARKPEHNILDKLLLPINDRLVYGKLRAAVGGCLHTVGSGAAPLDPKLNAFFWNIGIPIYHGYGSSECSSGVTVNHPGRVRHGTVGPRYPSFEVKIAANGEVLARGPCLMRGYHNAPELTAEVIDEDGWYHTGDLGEFDADGFLVITGRIKEIMKTSGGKMITPVPLEQALSHTNLVDMAMVVAEGRKCVGALLVPDPDRLSDFKRKHGLESMRDEEIFTHGAFEQETERLLAHVNKKFSEWQRIRKVRWIAQPLSIEGGELTPTLKIRRGVVEKKYAELIDSMFET